MAGHATILLVDDERMVRDLVGAILQRHGYAVLEAHCGAEALRICREHAGPIHLLLTDVLMPEMNGRALAEQIRSFRPDIRILYMSGYTGHVFPRHLDGQSAIAYIQKPFTSADLARKVREVLEEDS
jgi:CheY-like chemotaxis protein